MPHFALHSGSLDLAPVITGLSPAAQASDLSMTIVGYGFSVNQGTVTVGGINATITSWTPRSITVIVPNTSSGNVYVTNHANSGGYGSNPAAFTLVLPQITSISPNVSIIGTAVTISGSNFGSQGTVTFNGVGAAISSWSASSIVAIAPTSTTGPVVVTNSYGRASNGVTYTYQTQLMMYLDGNLWYQYTLESYAIAQQFFVYGQDIHNNRLYFTVTGQCTLYFTGVGGGGGGGSASAYYANGAAGGGAGGYSSNTPYTCYPGRRYFIQIGGPGDPGIQGVGSGEGQWGTDTWVLDETGGNYPMICRGGKGGQAQGGLGGAGGAAEAGANLVNGGKGADSSGDQGHPGGCGTSGAGGGGSGSGRQTAGYVGGTGGPNDGSQPGNPTSAGTTPGGGTGAPVYSALYTRGNRGAGTGGGEGGQSGPSSSGGGGGSGAYFSGVNDYYGGGGGGAGAGYVSGGAGVSPPNYDTQGGRGGGGCFAVAVAHIP